MGVCCCVSVKEVVVYTRESPFVYVCMYACVRVLVCVCVFCFFGVYCVCVYFLFVCV